MLRAGTYVHMCIRVNRYIIYIYHIVCIQFYNLDLHIKYILYIYTLIAIYLVYIHVRSLNVFLSTFFKVLIFNKSILEHQTELQIELCLFIYFSIVLS